MVIPVRYPGGEYEVRMRPLTECWAALPNSARVITDANVAAALAPLPFPEDQVLVLPPGEGTKTMAFFESAVRWLASSRAIRTTPVVALGGGVIGDLAGFAAAGYFRGVPLIMVPTSLLAMVDSAVGGKVGIDLPEGKNLVGAFHRPQAVWVPIEVLASLPKEHFVNGSAEVWKYGCILDPTLLERLLRAPLAFNDPDLEDVVARCIRLKAEVVGQDEREVSGLRAILNFGHTVGHALEAVTGYDRYLHGQAIAIGMVIEARLGERLGVTEPGLAELLAVGLQRQGLPVDLPLDVDRAALLEAMRHDKKVQGPSLAFSLVERPGACKLYPDVPEAEVQRALQT